MSDGKRFKTLGYVGGLTFVEDSRSNSVKIYFNAQKQHLKDRIRKYGRGKNQRISIYIGTISSDNIDTFLDMVKTIVCSLVKSKESRSTNNTNKEEEETKIDVDDVIDL